MTIHFVPGDPNKSIYALFQAQWRDHYIVAYGSGNNLIISTISGDVRPSLQTVYMDQDPTAVCINGNNGLICISCGSDILVFKPLNEYMSIPRWSEVARIRNDKTTINCLRWAVLEDELAVGSGEGLTLYHLYIEYGEVKYVSRWSKAHASPVEGLDITADASKIVTYNSSNYDSFAKVWMRINYGDSNSLFDLVYCDHSPHKWLLDFRWRQKSLRAEKEADDEVLASMVNIKNMRSFMPTSASEDNDILYTITNDLMLNVWATFDFSGHSHLKLWTLLDLKRDLKSDYRNCLIIDNVHLQNSLYKNLKGATDDSFAAKFFASKDLTNIDLLLVQGSFDSVLYAVVNVNSNPPNNIIFEKICNFPTAKICLPDYSLINPAVYSEELNHLEPIHSSCILNVAGTSSLSYLVHDRIKNTLRLIRLSFESLVNGLTTSVSLVLKDKFQGHAKSIQKLVTSSTSLEGNIMLSILSFPEQNYIWEPLLLNLHQREFTSITKRFCLNVTRDPLQDTFNQGIVDAILINDIYPPKEHLRHHLAIVVEKGGYLSIWECNGTLKDDGEATLVIRLEITADNDGDRLNSAPQALILKAISDFEYVVLSVYDVSVIRGWKVDILHDEISCISVPVDPLPGDYSGKVAISAVDTYLEKDISVIDEKGVFKSIGVEYCQKAKTVVWVQTSVIHTNIERASFINGASLINKLAVVDESGSKLSIWDCKSGLLEYEELFPPEHGKVRDLDWTFIGDKGSTANAILSVGFPRFCFLYAQLRYDYTNNVPSFAAIKKLDISDYTPHQIGDLIWLDEEYLVVGCGNQFFIEDKWVSLENNSSSGNEISSINNTIRQLMVGYEKDNTTFLMSDLMKILNGPLPVYHPQFLIQSLLMNEIKMVEEILVKLLKVLRTDREIKWNLDFDLLDAVFHTTDKKTVKRRPSLFSMLANTEIEVFEEFNSSLADLLIEKLTTISLPFLTRHQQITLSNVVGIVSKFSSHKGSLDENGFKFFYGFDLFQSSRKQSKLSMRDISWALHSDQKEMIFSMLDNHYQHRLTWDNVKQVGLVYWVDKHRMTSLIETVARNEFGSERDPSGRVAVLYMAIKKKQVLVGLWRTVSHPEREKMLKFLSNDFTESRWQSAAQKNAFVLLSKHRYIDAACFFLLAGKIKDCCITLCNKVEDVELALAVAKVNSDREALMHIIEQFILPKALLKGDRWMTSWVFWEMKLKEISIQALVKWPIDVVKQNIEQFSPSYRDQLQRFSLGARSKIFLRDDPVLAVLYQKLRASKLNYLKGSLGVKPDEEFQFVVKVSTIYSRMGCDYLALLLMRRWKFLDYSLKKDKSHEKASKNIFEEFSGTPNQSNGFASSVPTAFEEPDMSSFNFGF